MEVFGSNIPSSIIRSFMRWGNLKRLTSDFSEEAENLQEKFDKDEEQIKQLGSIVKELISQQANDRKLRVGYAYSLLIFLFLSVVFLCTLIILSGLKIIQVDQVLFDIVATGVIVQIFPIITIVVKNIFGDSYRKVLPDTIKAYLDSLNHNDKK